MEPVFPLEAFKLWPIPTILVKLKKSLRQTHCLWLHKQEKASFFYTYSKKSVGPIFLSAGPISQHTALQEPLTWTVPIQEVFVKDV